MTDITKCTGYSKTKGTCAIRDNCRRFTAPSGDFQSMFKEAPFEVKMDGTACERLWYEPTHFIYKG